MQHVRRSWDRLPFTVPLPGSLPVCGCLLPRVLPVRATTCRLSACIWFHLALPVTAFYGSSFSPLPRGSLSAWVPHLPATLACSAPTGFWTPCSPSVHASGLTYLRCLHFLLYARPSFVSFLPSPYTYCLHRGSGFSCLLCGCSAWVAVLTFHCCMRLQFCCGFVPTAAVPCLTCRTLLVLILACTAVYLPTPAAPACGFFSLPVPRLVVSLLRQLFLRLRFCALRFISCHLKALFLRRTAVILPFLLLPFHRHGLQLAGSRRTLNICCIAAVFCAVSMYLPYLFCRAYRGSPASYLPPFSLCISPCLSYFVLALLVIHLCCLLLLYTDRVLLAPSPTCLLLPILAASASAYSLLHGWVLSFRTSAPLHLHPSLPRCCTALPLDALHACSFARVLLTGLGCNTAAAAL